MKVKIQNKINRYRALANSPVMVNVHKTVESFRNNDSLAKAIRNEKEADIFLSELNTVVKVALTK